MIGIACSMWEVDLVKHFHFNQSRPDKHLPAFLGWFKILGSSCYLLMPSSIFFTLYSFVNRKLSLQKLIYIYESINFVFSLYSRSDLIDLPKENIKIFKEFLRTQ